MNYITLATDYIRELKAKGVKSRKKAQAFMDYWEDVEAGDHNSYGFYAKAWGVSKSTSYAWIKEFDYEIDRFISGWELRKNYHYEKIKNLENAKQDKSVKFSTERIERLEPNESNGTKLPKNGGFEDSDRTILKNEPNEVFNNNTTTTSDHLTDRNFNELLFVYRCNGGNSQNTAETYEAYKRSLQEIKDVKLLKVAIIKYLQDSKLENKVWFKRFLEEKIYQKYLRPHYKLITLDNKELFGAYDEEVERFYTDDKKAFPIDKSKFYELIAEDRLLIEGYTL